MNEKEKNKKTDLFIEMLNTVYIYYEHWNTKELPNLSKNMDDVKLRIRVKSIAEELDQCNACAHSHTVLEIIAIVL